MITTCQIPPSAGRTYRILQLGKFFPIKGGIEKVEATLMRELSNRGVRCDMLCASNDGSHGTRKAGELATFHLTRTVGRLASTMLSPAMVTTLRRICHDYDLIDIHHPDPMAALALRLSGFKGKVVLHWHCDIQRQRIAYNLYRPLQHWLLQRADTIICTSSDYAKASKPLRKVQRKIKVVPLGVAQIRPNASAVEALRKEYASKKIIFALGRLVPYKGFDRLIESARYLSDDYHIIIGGDGPLRESLLSSIARYGLHDCVTLTGSLTDAEVANYFGLCDVFCLPSVSKAEAFGLVQAEAMSCAKPVVSTRIKGSGVAWVNQDQITGLTVPVNDPIALADAFEHLLTDAERYRFMSMCAKDRFEHLFTTKRMIQLMLIIYDRLLQPTDR